VDQQQKRDLRKKKHVVLKGVVMSKMLLNTRRNYISWFALLGLAQLWIVCLPLVLLVVSIALSVEARAQSDTIQTNVPALKNVYANDFTIGCILSYRNIGFPSDPYVSGQSSVVTPNGGYLVKFHMNCMTPGNNMKPQYTVDITSSASAYSAATSSQAKDSIETHPVVKFNGDIIAQLNWAKRQGFRFRGHVLVWHSQTPTELFRSGYKTSGTRLTKDKMIQRTENYIKEVIRLIREGWPGLLSAMDVVNEAVNDNTGTDRTDSEWYITFGDNSYIMKAFELARKYTVQYGETQMKLYYNDYNEDNPDKADGIVRICAPIYRAGYLDGIGMQGHEAINRPTAAQWIATYDKFDTICTEMAITEYYVDQGTSSPTPASLNAQANQYAMLFKLFVERSYFSGGGKIINLTKDGLNDQYTLFPNTLSSLWDSKNQCKPAFYAVADVGMDYNALDSLISCADTLQQDKYTIVSWSNFATALALAKSAMAQDYSASISAATALGQAKDGLKAAIDGLVKVESGVELDSGNQPKAFALMQNYPNPFNPTTDIKYSVPEKGYVSLKVYDLLGVEVATLFDGVRQAGSYVATFDGRGLTSGIYIYRIVLQPTEGGRRDGFTAVKKMMMVR
jgi:endo-1,4-beta-xylanase